MITNDNQSIRPNTPLHNDQNINRSTDLNHQITLSTQIVSGTRAVNIDEALSNRESKMLKEEVNKVLKKPTIWEMELKTLGNYSIGLELYLLMVKQFSVLFLIISIISV